MLSIDMKNKGKEPKYEYIYRCIKKQILDGSLLANEKLPSKRSLAESLEVSVVTAETAYDQLAAEGFIYSREKSGYYVNRLVGGGIETLPCRSTKYIDEKPTEKYIADLSGRLAEANAFPSTVWAKLMRGVLTREDVMHPVGFAGAYELRNAIAGLLRRMRGMDIDPRNIIIGAGTEHLYNLMIQLLGRERVFAVEDPGYGTIAKIYDANEVKFKYVSVDDQGAIVNGLKADVLHISPAHHFPTGRVMSALRRGEALLWAQKNKAYIIEDEYDSEFRLRGMPVEPLKKTDVFGRVIYVNTFAKSISPALRISYMILPPKLMDIYEKKLGFYSCAVPTFEQYTLASFIEEGYFEKHINRIRIRSGAIRASLMKCLREANIDAKIIEEDAGQHFMLSLNTEISDKEISYRLKEHGIRLPFLSDYTHSPKEEDMHIAIMNYSSLSEGSIPEVVRVLTQVLNE